MIPDHHAAARARLDHAARTDFLFPVLPSLLYRRAFAVMVLTHGQNEKDKFIACKATEDKLSRLVRVTPMIEAGLVMLPHDAPWLAAFETELFPIIPLT